MKAYNLSIDYVLYEMSFVNMIMYGAVLPSYKSRDKSDINNSQQEVVKADDPGNRERVREIIEQFD